MLAVNAVARFVAGPALVTCRRDDRGCVRLHDVPEEKRTEEVDRAVILHGDREGTLGVDQTTRLPCLVDLEVVALRRRRGTAAGAGLINLDVADARGVVAGGFLDQNAARGVEVLVDVDHVGCKQRVGRIGIRSVGRVWTRRAGREQFVIGLDRRALQAVDLARVGPRSYRRLDASARNRAQRIAGHPQGIARTVTVGVAGFVVAVAEVDAAGRPGPEEGGTDILAVVEADVVAIVRQPDAVGTANVAQHARGVRNRERIHGIEAEIAYAAALGDDHQIAGYRDVGRRARRRIGVHAGQGDLQPNVGSYELAGCVDADRPDRVHGVVAAPLGIVEGFRTPDAVIEARLAGASRNRHAPDAAAEIGEVPARRRGCERQCRARCVGARTDQGRTLGVEGNRSEVLRRPDDRVVMARTAVDAVIVGRKKCSVGRQPMHDAGLQIGDEELVVGGVERDVAEPGPGVGAPVQADRRDEFRRIAGRAVELVDAAGPAFTPLAGQPVGFVLEHVEAEGRGRGQVDVGGVVIVDRNAKDLADLTCGYLQVLRLVDPVPPVRRESRIAHVDRAADDTVLVDDLRHGAVADIEFHGSGEPCRVGFAGRERLLGGCDRGCRQQHRRRRKDTTGRYTSGGVFHKGGHLRRSSFANRRCSLLGSAGWAC